MHEPTHPAQTDPAPRQQHRNGFGITALCLALTGLVFGLIPLTGFLAIILGALALVFGLLGLGRARRGEASNKKMTVIASVLGAGALALGIWGLTIVINTVDEVNQELEQLDSEFDSLEN
ncbi:DUF4190 domain-containing protein [Saccharomonospora saliphila]|uniref:DUF4190 domain-containing protein n=1 Tax=Saccharomonospora saliphila TaxID=369829 RepID=UPI0003803A0F|nr:DUF4190 domain-containing protein [Saccharomonospora saliphila]